MNPISRFFAPSVRRRILATFGIVTVLVLMMAIASFVQLSQVRTFSEQIIPNSAQMGNLQSLALATSALDADLERFLVIRGVEYRDNVLKDLENMAAALDAMQTDTATAALPAVQELKAISARLQPEINALLDVETTGAAATDINQRIVAVYADIDQAKQLQQPLSADTLARLQTTAATQGRITSDVITQTAILGIIVFAITVITSVLINRTLRPIATLTETATAIAAGDLNRTAPIQSRDEIGTLASAFNTMTTQLRGMMGSLEDRVNARTEQLRASAEVGHAASSILNTDQLIHTMVNLIGERFNFYYVAAFTVDESGRWATLRDATGQAGQQLLDQGHALAIGGRSMVGTAIRERKPRIALDVGTEAVRFANPLLPDTRSEIALPLIAGDQVLGALDVQSTQSAAFDENSAILLQGMADQIAVALNNADQYQREQAHVEQANHLLQTAIELSEQTDRAALQDRLLVSALALLKADSVQYWTEDENRIELKAAQSGHPATERGLLINRELAAQVFQTGLISRLDSAPTQADYTSRMTDVPFQAALITPVTWQGKVIGVLIIMRTQPGQLFTQDDENSAQLLAAQVSAAFQNIALAEQRQHSLDELNNLNRRLIGQAWEKYLQASGQISAEWREGAWLKDEGRSAKQKDAMSIVPYQAANLQLPIKVRGQTIGEFNVMTTGTPHTWSEEDITFAQSLVDQAGQMLENVRLLEETERFAHREQRIREITTRIRAADDIQGVLEATAVELARSMGVPRAIVRLTTSDSVRQEIQDSEKTDN